MQSMYRFAAN